MSEVVSVGCVREQQSDLRAAVTALLPFVRTGRLGSRNAVSEALTAAGVVSGCARDVALLVGAVQSARAFVLLGECLGEDPEVVWQNYLALCA